MIYLESFLYYIFLSSTLLFYGVGINRVAEIGFKNEVNITFYVKFILSIFITAVLAWLVTYCLLLPIGLIELFPITTFLLSRVYSFYRKLFMFVLILFWKLW